MSMDEGKRNVLRDSDNPIIEEYKDDLSHKSRSFVRDEERIIRLEGLANELLSRIKSLELRIQVLEEK